MPYQLDFLSLDSIKRHLPPTERVFFEPLNISFASINLKCQRLSLKLSLEYIPVPQLTIYNKKGQFLTRNINAFADVSKLLPLILSRFDRFHTITIIAFRGVFVRTLESLLSAAVDNDVTDVRRIELSFSDTSGNAANGFLAWLNHISPSIRHLQVQQFGHNGIFQSGHVWHQEVVLAVIGNCHRLRSIDLLGMTIFNLPSAALMDVISTLPHLRCLRIADGEVAIANDGSLPKPAPRNSLTLNTQWLEDVALQPSMKQCLQKIDLFIFYNRRKWTLGSPALNYNVMTDFDCIVSSMRPSAIVPRQIVVYWNGGYLDAYPATWRPSSLNNWLLLTGHHRLALMLIGPTLPTADEFTAIKEAIEEASIAGLEMPLPVHDSVEITFKFHNGANVRVKLDGVQPQ